MTYDLMSTLLGALIGLICAEGLHLLAAVLIAEDEQ